VLQTLFYIPHEIAGMPVFGFGWALLAWAVGSAVLLGYSVKEHGFGAETRGYVPVLAIFGLVILFLIPALEESIADTSRDGEPLGVPIRSYGVMLLIAVTAGVAVAVRRARQMGLDPEVIYSLTFWMFIFAIVGARAFYVAQKWDQFVSDSWPRMLGSIVNVPQGGLVVYGALVGGLAAAAAFVYRRGLPALALGDLIAPSLVLGLAIGRIGCLLNGCCYGDICTHSWAIQFPQLASQHPNSVETPPYEYQHRTGLLHGFRIGGDADGQPVVVEILDEQGPAATAGLRVGDRILRIRDDVTHEMVDVDSDEKAKQVLARSGPRVTLETADNRSIGWSISKLPSRSRPTHPTQIYSSINAAILFLFLSAYIPFRRRDGEVIALLLTLYAVTRYLIELIRTDEAASFWWGLTISQVVSLLTLAAVVGLWIYIFRQPTGSIWQRSI
jgi:phosphatidylglycerol:prolipoprotein diacylglycerol transferase